MNTEAIAQTDQSHLTNAGAILEALSGNRSLRFHLGRSEYLGLPGLKPFQRRLFARFSSIITQPSFDYISKTPDGWLIVGDHRQEIAMAIQLLIERHGLGIGLLVLHAQQICSGHIPTQIQAGGETRNLATPTESLHGLRGEHVLSIPIRRFRADFEKLAALNIAKPRVLWDPRRIVTHERDRQPCFYCSCPEINPAEVIVDIEASRHGLSRHYSLGFTFAPFGNPLSAMHFLAWDRAHNPLNMNRTPVTVSDLVKLTRLINTSIRNYFSDWGKCDYPVLDGLSNGWAGNTVYHQHFQFFQPEHPSPILRSPGAGQTALVQRDDVRVQRLEWPTPIYRIRSADALNTGLVGNDLAGLWRFLGGSRTAPYKSFRDGYVPAEGERVPAHTQNLYVPGRFQGLEAFLVLRDRERVDFKPLPGEWLNSHGGHKAQPKQNIGALESTGTLIQDDEELFAEMKQWSPGDISDQIRKMIDSIAPEGAKVADFEAAVRDLFPQ